MAVGEALAVAPLTDELGSSPELDERVSQPRSRPAFSIICLFFFIPADCTSNALGSFG